jgi:hypothetical protein
MVTVFGVQQEDVVVRRGKRRFAMTARRNRQWLGHLDAERLDDRMHARTPYFSNRAGARRIEPTPLNPASA